jgi:hypothetical protein
MGLAAVPVRDAGSDKRFLREVRITSNKEQYSFYDFYEASIESQRSGTTAGEIQRC